MSSWQGHPNWPAAKPFICGAVAKAGESFHEDPTFAYNWFALKRLGMFHAAYWFIRGQSECGSIIRVLNSVGYRGDHTAGPIVLDEEVPSAYGTAIPTASCLHGYYGHWPVIYTSPGTWPGGGSGGLGLWIADFGPGFPCIWTCSPLAWQFASPPFVYFYLPHLGYIDVSVDLRGFTRDFVWGRSPPPNPYAIYPVGPVGERGTVVAYDKARRDAAHNARYLRRLEPQLHFLAARVAWLAMHVWGTQRHPGWRANHAGARYQGLIHRAEGRRVV